MRRLDHQIKESHRRIRTAVRASKTSLTELYGVGPIVACAVIGHTGDVRRFANRDHFAAYAGVAPIEHSSGGRIAHRLSRRGNRKLNNAIHIAAISPRSAIRAFRWPDLLRSQGGRGQDQARSARSFKRQISNALYRQFVLDAERGPGGH